MKTFFCAKLHVKANKNPMDELLKQAKAWFDKIRSIDSTAIIYAYKYKKPASALFSASDIPDSLIPFRNYFNNATTKSIAGHVWMNMYIGHSLSSDTIVKKMKEYRDRTDTWTMVKKLQARFIAIDYFLLWYTDYMDTAALTKAIHKEIELISEEKFQFALTWSPIKGENGRTYQCAKSDRYKKKELSAIHIQVPNDEKDATYEMLSNFFGLDNITPILGREMLMVPIIRATNAAHKNENIEHLISKQHYFYTQNGIHQEFRLF